MQSRASRPHDPSSPRVRKNDTGQRSPRDAAPRDEVQPQADRPQGGHGRRRQEAVRGQLRHGARDGLLGVGDSGDGRRVARCRPRTQGPTPARAALEAVGRPLEFFFLGGGDTATPVDRLRFRREAPSRSNEMRSREGHARILECRTCVEQTRPPAARSQGEDR